MLVAAASGVRIAAGKAAATDLALGDRDARADLIPDRLAAGRVDGAHGVTARLIVAIRRLVREAARSSLRRSAQRIRAGGLAGSIDSRRRGAEIVPLRGAAEDVDEAHRIAASLVVAPRRQLRFTALARAGVAAAVLVVLAAGRTVDAGGTFGVPFSGAAEGINCADRGAAGAVAARGLVVGNIASTKADIAAFGQVGGAYFARPIRAVRVPLDLTAVLERLVRAHVLAAFADRTAWGLMRGEAVSCDNLTTAAEAGFTRSKDAGRIPADLAAERLEAADRLAAGGVVAVRSAMGQQAASCTGITAAWHSAADELRERRAASVPALRAAEFVDVAHASAADLVLTARRLGMLLEAAPRARAVPAVACRTQRARCADTGGIPLDLAAEWICVTYDRAAGGVGASRSEVDGVAGLLAGAVAEAPADPLGDVHAALVPAEAAADWVDGADGSAALRVGAAARSMHHERGARSWASAWSGAADTGIRRTCLVPCPRAAGRIECADHKAAVVILARGQIARDGARTRTGIAAGNSVVDADGAGVDDAEDVPLRGAATRIHVADAVAAFAVEAGRGSVRIEAAAGADVAAAVAEERCALRAGLVPLGERFIAAERIVVAHGDAAGRIGAAGALVRHVAAAEGRRAEGVDGGVVADGADRAGRLNAGEVPADRAAEVVEVADLVAAHRVRAARLRMDRAARACGGVGGIDIAAYARALAAGRGRQLAADRVPARLAAEAVDRADLLAAHAVVAVRRRVLVAAAARAGIAA